MFVEISTQAITDPYNQNFVRVQNNKPSWNRRCAGDELGIRQRGWSTQTCFGFIVYFALGPVFAQQINLPLI